MLPDELFADQALRLALFVQCIKIKKRQAKLIGGEFSQRQTFDKLVLDQIADQRHLVTARLLIGLLRRFFIEKLGNYKLLGQTRKHDISHYNHQTQTVCGL